MRAATAILIAACWAAPVRATPILSDYGANLEAEVLAASGHTLVHLRSGPPIMGGAIARGLFDDDDTDRTPARDTLWVVQNLNGDVAPDGKRIVSFSFDRTGNFLGIEPTPFFDPDVVAGIEPTPFRVFLAAYPPDPVAPPERIGELDFSHITAATLGSIDGISGLALVNRNDNGSDLAFAPFSIQRVVAPGSWALLLAGLPGLMMARRSRRRLN